VIPALSGFVAAWVCLYFVVMWPLLWAMRRLPPTAALGDNDAVRVSIVVSARNEARDLPRCIAALLALDYPRDLLEIILVDDLSDDSTGRIVDEAAPPPPQCPAPETPGAAVDPAREGPAPCIPGGSGFPVLRFFVFNRDEGEEGDNRSLAPVGLASRLQGRHGAWGGGTEAYCPPSARVRSCGRKRSP